MTQLLIVDAVARPMDASHAFGGVPRVPAGFAWPKCAACRGPMRYLGRLGIGAGRSILLFQCGNRPGLCDEWEADAGGNRAIVLDDGAASEAIVPGGDRTLRASAYAGRAVDVEADDYDDARERWARDAGRSPREVLGQLGGDPTWLSANATPTCDACGGPMAFVAQLEEGPKVEDEMNFGGGLAYVFVCPCPARVAKLLYQC